MSAPADKPRIVFAYGSNMATRRIRERCPSARSVGIAELLGYELRWHKRSHADGSGKCDVVESSGASVWGVLFEIAPDEKPALDRAEGLGKGYEQIVVEVLIGGKSQAAAAYVATDIDPNLMPYTWYCALVIHGAKEHGLPAQYIAELEAVPTIADLDRERHRKGMALLCEVQL